MTNIEHADGKDRTHVKITGITVTTWSPMMREIEIIIKLIQSDKSGISDLNLDSVLEYYIQL